jgi:hypothetical protein
MEKVQSSGFKIQGSGFLWLNRYRCYFEKKSEKEENVGAGVVLPPLDDSTLGMAVQLPRQLNPVRNPVLG